MSNGLLYLKNEETGEYDPITGFDEMKTFDDEGMEEEKEQVIKLDVPEFSCGLYFTPTSMKRCKKALSGFMYYKGPARYKSLNKCIKYMHNSYAVTAKYLRMFLELGYIKDTETITCPVDVSGLPCTDIWEYFWFRKAVVENASEYSDYKYDKTRRTARSRNRIRRKNNG